MQAGSRGEPRLRMGHLLLWVVGCAIGFAERRSLTPTNLPTDRVRVMVFSSNVAWGMALGTIFTGCALLAYRRWRGDTDYPSRAGHWLLLRGLAVDATWSASAYSRLSLSARGSIVLMVDLAFLWGLRRRLPRHWVAVFLVSSILAAVRAVGFMAFEFYHDTSILMSLRYIGAGSVLLDAIVILRAIGRDGRSGVPTDGLHRLGIVTVLALDALSAIFYLA
jgi:hypothetical protein